MKIKNKIKFLITALMLITSSIAFGIEEVILQSDDKNPEIIEEPILLEPEDKKSVPEERYTVFSKEALKGIIKKDYNTDSADGMLRDQLRTEFEKGPIKETQLQGNFINNITETFVSSDNDTKFNPQLINIGIKGKFRSEKEKYNTLFDLTPNIHENFFHRLVLDAWMSGMKADKALI